MGKREALFWHQTDSDRVRCDLCPHGCKIKDGGVGLCRVRGSRGGKLFTLNYGEVASLALDPIEKKPLYHFYPGRNILSVGSVGCNFACGYCQNHSLAHGTPSTSYVSPEQLVSLAEEAQSEDSIGIAYTYSEPGVWYEFVLDTALLARSRALKNVLVTNGYLEEGPLQRLLPCIDAMNIDLKSFDDGFYRHTCKGRLAPVQRTIELSRATAHIEITTLLITGLNDSPEEVDKLCSWLASLDKSIVLHLSRYHPAWKFNLPPTPVESLQRAWEIARGHLEHVYVGNIGGFDNDTRCSGCSNPLVRRQGFRTAIIGAEAGQCFRCGKRVPFEY